MSGREPELLSQEEIDALLAEIDMGGRARGEAAAAPPELPSLVEQLLPALADALPGGAEGLSPAEAAVVRGATGFDGDDSAGGWLNLSGARSGRLGVAVRPAAWLGFGSPPDQKQLTAWLRSVAAGIESAVGVKLTPGKAPAARETAAMTLVRIPWRREGAAGELLVALSEELAGAAVQAEPPAPPPGGAARAEAAAARATAPVVYPEFGGDAGHRGSARIDLLLDVPLEVTVELGRTRRQVRDLLALGPGALIELDKLAGEAVDVLVNGKPIARGEVVVIDEYFGVRITEILSPAERLQRLR